MNFKREDLKKYSENELSLLVFNTEYFYKLINSFILVFLIIITEL